MPDCLSSYIINHGSDTIRCPECMKRMRFDDFYPDHVKNCHGLIRRLCCVFCFGAYRWPKGEKCKRKDHTAHVYACAKQFRKKYFVPEPRIVSPRPDTSHVKCRLPPVAFRPRDRLSEYVGFYDSLFEKPDMWRGDGGGVKFDERSGLGHDVYWMLQRYLRKDLDWYHLMVKHTAFETFVDKMEPIRDEFVLLPFWCLCDGLMDENGRKQTHRHMIAACNKVKEGQRQSVFLNVLSNQVRFDVRDSNKAKYCKKIVDAQHLLYTIAYVSGPKAACDTGIPNLGHDDDDFENASHYNLSRPFYVFGKAFLFTMLETGINKFLSKQIQNRTVLEWREFAKRGGSNYNWRVPIGKTGWPMLNYVIPVDRRYEPVTNVTDPVDFCLHLYEDRPLGFKENLNLLQLTEDEWYEHQVRKGNTFRSIENEWYVLSRKQQYAMNQIKAMEEQTKNAVGAWWESKYSQLAEKSAEFEKENYALKLKLVEMEKKCDEKCFALEKENEALKLKLVEMEKKCVEMERDALVEKLAMVENERDAFKMKLAMVENERDAFKMKYSELLERFAPCTT